MSNDASLNGHVEEGTAIEGLPALSKGRAAPPLDAYIAEARESARLTAEHSFSRFRPAENQKEKNERKQEIEARVELAEKYARWRWNGYVNGEIVGL